MRIRSIAWYALAALSVSCASLGDSMFLLNDVSQEHKSDAVTEAGKEAYKRELISAGDISASGEVQRYFEVALRFDPDNAEAAKYLALVEDFRASRFAAAVKDAEKLLKKEKRTPDDEYTMLLAVQKAQAIYPRDEAAVKLVRSTSEAKAAYVAARLEEADKIRSNVKPDSKEAVKEKAYIDAFKIVMRVKAIDPADDDGAKAYRELKEEISKIVEKRLGTVTALTGKQAYDEARATLVVVKDLDSKIGQSFKAEVAKAEYGLYLSWAKYHETRKEWSKAESRVRAALAVQKGSDALALQKRVAEAAAAEERGATFEQGLKNLDAYIASGELVRGQRVLSSLSKSSTSSAQRQALDQRRAKLVEALDGVYQAGLKAYREERFKDAVTAFETVMAVDASFAEAGDYLEKAKAKQKLLDQY